MLALTNHFVMTFFFVIVKVVIPEVLSCIRGEMRFISPKPQEVNLWIMHNFKLFPNRNSIAISLYSFCKYRYVGISSLIVDQIF